MHRKVEKFQGFWTFRPVTMNVIKCLKRDSNMNAIKSVK